MLAEKAMNIRIFAIFLVAFGWTVQSRAEVINRIVATVDDEPITLYEMQSVRNDENASQKYMLPPGSPTNLPDKDILEAIIMTRLIGKEVEAQGIKASDAEVDNYIERIKSQGNLSDEAMKEALAKQGLTMETYREQVRGEIERGMLINREIGARVNVTPEEVEQYYKEHGGGRSSTTSDEQVRVRHIFLPLSPAASEEDEKAALDQMQDIRKRAVGGEDFATLANTYSRGPGAGQGGDLGFFKKGQMTKEIDTVAFSLKAGEISQPFRNEAGVHLIKVEEHRAAGEQASEKMDPEEAERIKQKLYNEALRERYERWFQSDLKFRHQVENFLVATPVRSSGEVSFKAVHRKEQTADKEPEQKGFLRRWLPF
jgi:peptidyl-prolyl cis-trans isomerase SurA